MSTFCVHFYSLFMNAFILFLLLFITYLLSIKMFILYLLFMKVLTLFSITLHKDLHFLPFIVEYKSRNVGWFLQDQCEMVAYSRV